MLQKTTYFRYISKIWGDKTILFLFFLNLITNAGTLSYYNSLQSVLYCVSISAFFASIESIIYHVLKKVRLHKVFLIIIVSLHVICLLVDVFLLKNFNTIFNQDHVDIIAQTYPEEVQSFFSTYLSIPFVICSVIAVVCLLIGLKKIALKLASKKIAAISLMVLSIAGVIIYATTVMNFLLYRNGFLVPQLHTFTRAANSSKVLFERQNQITTLRDINSNISVTHSSDSEYVDKIIVIIGESFTPFHSSLYGYNKDTNPLLSKRAEDGSLTVFSDVVTFSDHTEGVMCSVFPLNPNPDEFFIAPLYPCCFKAAGYHTMLLDNQYFAGKGIMFLSDEKLSSLMFDYRNTKQYQYDGELFKEIKFTDDPQLIVLHLQGQHYTYSKKYPKEFTHFKSSDYSNLLDEQKEIVAHYDNATLYNDFLINQLIESVEDKDCIVVYFSDHGEEIFEIDDYVGHGNAVKRQDPIYQMRVPLFVWTSKEFCNKHKEIAERIKKSKDRPIITSDIPHFLMDVASLEMKQYNPEQSFINDDYKIKKRIILNTVDYETIKNQPRVKSRYY